MRKQPVRPTKDLHGLRKDAAIREVTQFLEVHRDRGWVCIITGKGQHSHDGPVLRDAVKKLLDKRRMKYSVNSDKGGFTVLASSGDELHKQDQPVDSKILVRPSNPENGIQLLGRAAPHGKGLAITTDEYALKNPRPFEILADDRQLEEAKRLSHREQSDRRKQDRDLERQTRQALSDSARELETLALCEQQENERIRQALRESQEEQCRQEEEEALQLERALAASESEVNIAAISASDDCDDALQRAMRESLVDANRQDDLDYAIELSLQDSQPIAGNQLEEVLHLSRLEK